MTGPYILHGAQRAKRRNGDMSFTWAVPGALRLKAERNIVRLSNEVHKYVPLETEC